MLGSVSPKHNGNEVGDLMTILPIWLLQFLLDKDMFVQLLKSHKMWGEEVYGELGDGAIGISYLTFL